MKNQKQIKSPLSQELENKIDLGKNQGNPDGLKLQKAVQEKVRDQNKNQKRS